MNRIFFTSDNHFGHVNILKKFCPDTRIGETVEDMDRMMIANWQRQVEPTDLVYLLGDVFFCDLERAKRIMNQLPGNKILVFGNHDQVIRKNPDLRNMFDATHEWLEIVPSPGKKTVLHHYPTYEWKGMHRGAYHLYGHIHSPYGEIEHPHIPGRCMDVGIDSRPAKDMTLWSWEEVDRILSKRAVRGHHEKEL